MGLVDEAVTMWERYREGTIAELENIPEEHWDRAPAAGARTLRELAQHIAETGVAFSAELASGEPNIMRLFDPAYRASLMSVYPAARTKAEIISLLKTTGADGAKRLRAAGDALATRMTQFMGAPVTVLTTLGFAASHEMYHRGQLATYARVAGAVPALTQQISAMMQQRAGR